MEGFKHTGYLDSNGTSRIHSDLQNHRSGGMLRMVNSTSKQLHVGIVGAGFAGLRCADVLLKHGAKVSIFEARDRLGGRVAQKDLGGHLVDLGPNWIHGTNDNPIMQLAQQTGTTLHSWDESSTIWDEQGSALSSREAGEYAALQWDDGLIADAFRYSNKHSSSIDPQTSLYDFYQDKIKNHWTDLAPAEAQRRRDTFLQVASIWGAYVGSEFTKQSLKFFWLEEVIEGENPFVAGTYSKILDAVASNAKANADIHLNSVVTKVQRRTAEQAASVQIADGTSHEFDEIVMTAPLGWLKTHKAAFNPALPSRTTQAIDSIGYGTLDKIYIRFPRAFWLDGTINVARTDESHGRSGRSGFFQWLAPIDEPHRWGQTGMNLALLPGDCAHPTVLFYTHGECSKHVANLITSRDSAEAAQDALIDFLRPYFSVMPNYDVGNEDCTPNAVMATAWANDEYAGYGSYTNFQIGLTQGDKDIETLREGLPSEGLWFAGEHTAPFIAMGTTTGAYWSGEKVAQRILAAHGVASQA